MRGASVLKFPASVAMAEMSLRATKSQDELVAIWWRDCDHFEGAERERLQAVYTEKLMQFAPMGRAG